MMHHESGFTLVELCVVTACVAVIAGLTVPNLVASRAAANERAVLATMRTIATAETQAMTKAALDTDGDGVGEAMSLPELAGTVDLRTTTRRIDPPALSPLFGAQQASGFVSHKGYLIALYLPDSAGVGVLGTPANSAWIDADAAEHSWTCLAWPLTRGASGSAAFFVNEECELLVCPDASYGGTLNPPPAGAALVGVAATTIVGGTLANGQVGADGKTWHPLR